MTFFFFSRKIVLNTSRAAAKTREFQMYYPQDKYPCIFSRETGFQVLLFVRRVDKACDWLIANLGTIIRETCEERYVETVPILYC